MKKTLGLAMAMIIGGVLVYFAASAIGISAEGAILAATAFAVIISVFSTILALGRKAEH